MKLRLPEPLLSLTRNCEVFCVAGCCGLDAFDVQASQLAPWVRAHGIASAINALNHLEALVNEVSTHAGEVWSDLDEFNAVWKEPRECLEYLDLWQREAVRALGAVAGTAVLDPCWLSCNGGIVRQLAQAFTETGASDLLPILADALEEAGCQNGAMLSHCRQPSKHVRACWVVRLLLHDEVELNQERQQTGPA